MSYKLYADDRCVEEIFSANELREKAGYAKVNPQEKKIWNCPNCGAPVSSYICEYCGTEFEKPKKVLTDEENRESFASFVREQKLRQIPYYREWQKQQLLDALNTYCIQSQIANIRDSINTHSIIQAYNIQDNIMQYNSQTNISPYQGPKEESKSQEKHKTKSADEELVEGLTVFMIGMLIFTILCIGVTIIYNL